MNLPKTIYLLHTICKSSESYALLKYDFKENTVGSYSRDIRFGEKFESDTVTEVKFKATVAGIDWSSVYLLKRFNNFTYKEIKKSWLSIVRP